MNENCSWNPIWLAQIIFSKLELSKIMDGALSYHVCYIFCLISFVVQDEHDGYDLQFLHIYLPFFPLVDYMANQQNDATTKIMYCKFLKST